MQTSKCICLQIMHYGKSFLRSNKVNKSLLINDLPRNHNLCEKLETAVFGIQQKCRLTLIFPISLLNYDRKCTYSYFDR